MAFGDLLGIANGSSSGHVGTVPISTTLAVNVGDLVVVAWGVSSSPSFTNFTDNLSATSWNTLAGGTATAQLQWAYKIADVAGNMTVSANYASTTTTTRIVAAQYAGPFASSPLDTNPASTIDSGPVSTHNCPATGVLAQANELIVAVLSINSANFTTLATSPLLLDNSFPVSFGHEVVASTSSVTPVFTTTDNNTPPNPSLLIGREGTASFVAGSTTTAWAGSATLTPVSTLGVDLQKLLGGAGLNPVTTFGADAQKLLGHAGLAPTALLRGSAFQIMADSAALGSTTSFGAADFQKDLGAQSLSSNVALASSATLLMASGMEFNIEADFIYPAEAWPAHAGLKPQTSLSSEAVQTMQIGAEW